MSTSDEIKAAVEPTHIHMVICSNQNAAVGSPGCICLNGIEQAVRRLREDDYDGGDGVDRDCRHLAIAYLADLAAREALEQERALLVTREWLESIGFRHTGDVLQIGPIELVHEDGGDWVPYLVLDRLPVLKSRGQLLDLLAGLKIDMKGKP